MARGINDQLREAIEKRTGVTVDQMRNTTIAEYRIQIEKKLGHKLSFHREFPFIGRGNVNGENVLSADEIDEEVDRALKE